MQEKEQAPYITSLPGQDLTARQKESPEFHLPMYLDYTVLPTLQDRYHHDTQGCASYDITNLNIKPVAI